MYDKLKPDDRQVLELYFCKNPDKLKREYLDMYGSTRSVKYY